MKLLSGIIAASAAGAMAAGTLGCARPVKPHRPLRIALYSQPLGFDPHRESEMLTASVGSHLYEGLTRLDSRLRLQPALADRWETSDNLNWRFHVRSGVRFHDGQELRAEDVVFSIERARDLPHSTVASYVGNVSKVAALDDSTVEISLDRPLALLAYKLSFVMIVRRGALEDATRPVGTGPYRLLTGSAELITLRAFERYWQGPPSEAEVELVVTSAYTNPALDRLIGSCAGTADPDQRLEIFAQATRLALAELPLVPLFHADQLFLVRPGVVWRPRLDGSVLAQEVRRN